TLYLKDYGYDMIHGVVNIPQTGLEISVIGPEKEKFWTEQALKRNEFQVKNGASLSIVIRQGKFLLNDEEFDTITSLLEALKNT
ncbi:MAG: hypothetical protein ACJA0X_001261, partial [Cyclobacteriaceae bacterium]